MVRIRLTLNAVFEVELNVSALIAIQPHLHVLGIDREHGSQSAVGDLQLPCRFSRNSTRR
jgi:hypothetical protein